MTDLGIAGVDDASLIASGGSALVYKATNADGQHIAVKVLRGMRGNEVTRRFEREQSAAERLSGHPNIMRILETGLTDAGEPYLVMPLIARGSLHDELEARGAFDLRSAIADVSIAAKAIEFAHSRGVLHRDIKPGNLLRADDGSIVVTDFGIARVTNAGITSATVGATTPLFAAPELLAENEVSVQSEVYALGALLYTLLAGRPSFSDTENIWATMHRIRTELPAPIAGVPAPVMRVIQRAMAKDPADRPQSAELFLTYLQTSLTADPDWWPPAPTTELRAGDPASPFETVERPQRLPVATPAAAGSGPPPAPAISRPAQAMGPVPRQETAGFKVLASLIALALVGGLAWWGTSRLFDSNSVDTAALPPVDNSIPSPEQGDDDPPETNGSDSPSPDTNASDLNGDDDEADVPNDAPAPTRLVSFNGQFFSAYLPEGWSVISSDVDAGYGFRSSFTAPDMYLNVDTTPREQRAAGGDIAASAREIASGINSASEVRTEELEDGLVIHYFTFRNRQGIDSIDIFFEVDGDGYAVLAGSASNPEQAFATARLVAASIRSNPDQ